MLTPTAGGNRPMNTRTYERLTGHCCNECIRRGGLAAKYPADSGSKSCLCVSCGRHGIGSNMNCEVRDWLAVYPVAHVEPEDV